MPGGPYMTALREVLPNRACEARSSSPMYASTSTIRPARVPMPSSRTSSEPSNLRAASRVGCARSSRRSVGRAVSGARSPPRDEGGGPPEGVTHVLREQEADEAQDHRDHV